MSSRYPGPDHDFRSPRLSFPCSFGHREGAVRWGLLKIPGPWQSDWRKLKRGAEKVENACLPSRADDDTPFSTARGNSGNVSGGR